jgi:tRNA A37 methylthiotransferase MiaB
VKPQPPRVGFVSLGCPKALVDAERILTQLRAEGYAVSPTYAGADLVIVYVAGVTKVNPGDFLDVKITRSDAHDLWAVPVKARSEPEAADRRGALAGRVQQRVPLGGDHGS